MFPLNFIEKYIFSSYRIILIPKLSNSTTISLKIHRNAPFLLMLKNKNMNFPPNIFIPSFYFNAYSLFLLRKPYIGYYIA